MAFDGTTPAGAGSTGCGVFRTSTRWDHPRGRGEHTGPTVHRMVDPGPPPRARGARREDRGRHHGPGTTPAGAGSTRSLTFCRRGFRDHPRGRGEHQRPICSGLAARGPPPRARGAQGGTCCFRSAGLGFYSLVLTPAYGTKLSMVDDVSLGQREQSGQSARDLVAEPAGLTGNGQSAPPRMSRKCCSRPADRALVSNAALRPRTKSACRVGTATPRTSRPAR